MCGDLLQRHPHFPITGESVPWASAHRAHDWDASIYTPLRCDHPLGLPAPCAHMVRPVVSAEPVTQDSAHVSGNFFPASSLFFPPQPSCPSCPPRSSRASGFSKSMWHWLFQLLGALGISGCRRVPCRGNSVTVKGLFCHTPSCLISLLNFSLARETR